MSGIDLATTVERRGNPRLAPASTEWKAAAALRPAQAVVLLNISRCGALVESSARLKTGVRTELHLAGLTARRIVRGRLARCHVASLDPLRYRGVVVFDQPQDLSEASAGRE